jgi:signal transduction histidine kinase
LKVVALTDIAEPSRGATPDLPTDHWPSVEAMKRADLGFKADLVARYFLVTLAGGLLFAATGQPLMLAWILIYLIANLSYLWMLTRTSGPVSGTHYATLVAMNMIGSGSFSFMTIYLSVHDSAALQTVGICGLAGHAMFNLSRHYKKIAITYWDTFSIAMSCLIIGGAHVTDFDGQWGEQLLIGFGSIAVAGYYVMAQRSVLDLNESLDAIHEETAQMQKMRALGQLTSGIAHDFNNLLTAMRGNVELAELAETDEERAISMNEAKEAADRAARLVNHLLAFSRKARLRPTIIDLPVFLEQFQRVALRVLPDSVQLDVDLDRIAPHVCGDPVQFEAALLNLAVNARDAMEPFGGRIQITATPFERDSSVAAPKLPLDVSYVHVCVSDSGPGANKEILSRMAEPFFTTKAIGKGSGLGLSMVKGFAEQSGGAAYFNSPHGTGLNVHLILPTGPRLHLSEQQ